MVREAKKLTANRLNAQIALSIICIPLSIIHSFSFAFILLDPKSGRTEKGMTVPLQVYHKKYELQVFDCATKTCVSTSTQNLKKITVFCVVFLKYISFFLQTYEI